MKRYFGQQIHWRDLDLAQMAFWPNAPRRWVLTLFSVLLLLGLMWGWVWPQAKRLQTELNHIQATQQQIRQSFALAPSVLAQMPPVRMIRHDEEPEWLANLASTARARQLNAMSFNVSEPSDAQRQKIRELVQYVVQQNSQLFQSVGDLPMGWLNQIGMVQISVQGSYTDVLGLVSDLGTHDEWLCIESSELDAVGSDQVRWNVSLWYFKEVAVKGVVPNAAK